MPATPDAPAVQVVVAFDFGLRRIGVAVGQSISSTASAIAVLTNDDDLWSAVDRLLGEWKPGRLLVGLPLGPNGEETETSGLARRFAGQLHGRFGLPVAFQDERLTSAEARQRFAASRKDGSSRRKDIQMLDAVAAKIMLETWFAEQG